MIWLSVVLVAAVWQQPSYEDALREARSSRRATTYRRELEPATRGARFRLGKMLVATDQLQEAERQMARAVRLSPNHAENPHELAQTLAALGRRTKARYHFEKSVELDPSLANAYLSYGNFAAQQGERGTDGRGQTIEAFGLLFVTPAQRL